MVNELYNMYNFNYINEATAVMPKKTKQDISEIPVMIDLISVNNKTNIPDHARQLFDLFDIILANKNYDFYPTIKNTNLNNKSKNIIVVITEFSVKETKNIIKKFDEVKNKGFGIETDYPPPSVIDRSMFILISTKLSEIKNRNYVKKLLKSTESNINTEYSNSINKASKITIRTEYRNISNTLNDVMLTIEYIEKNINELEKINLIDANKKQNYTDKIQKLNDAKNYIETQVSNIITNIDNSVKQLSKKDNYSNTDLDKIIKIFTKIQALYDTGLIDKQKRQTMLFDISTIKNKLNISTPELNKRISYQEAKDVAAKVNDFINNMPNNKNEIFSKYQDLLLDISNLEDKNKKDAEEIKIGLNEAVKTALGILKISEETKGQELSKDDIMDMINSDPETQNKISTPESKVKDDYKSENTSNENDENTPNSEKSEMLIDYGEGKTFTEYEIMINLPLDRYVKVDNLQNIEGNNLNGGKDIIYNDIFHNISRTMDVLLGYRATGLAANTVNAMRPITYTIGKLMGFVARNSINVIVGSIVRAKHGFYGDKARHASIKVDDVTTKIGDFIKYEIINHPEQINPVSAEFADYLNERFGFRRKTVSRKYLSSPHSTYVPEPKRIRDFSSSANRDINEDMGGGMAESGVPGGGNMPATGMGNPIPPTPDQTPFDSNGNKTPISDSGSGDIFDKIFGFKKINKKKKHQRK